MWQRHQQHKPLQTWPHPRHGATDFGDGCSSLSHMRFSTFPDLLIYIMVIWSTGAWPSSELYWTILAYCAAFGVMLFLVSRIIHISHQRHMKANSAYRPVWQLNNLGVYIRLFTVFIASFVIYNQLHALTALFQVEDQDAVLRQIDQWLTGGYDPTIVLQAIVSPLLTEYFRFVYSLYLVLFFATPMLLCLQNRPPELNNLVLSLFLTLYIGFIGYTLVPAIGPYVYPPLRDAYTVTLDGNPLADAQAKFIDAYSYPRSVFPSLHTAVSAVILVYVYRYQRELRWIFLILVVSIWCSTVYLRYHYLIDLIAGWLLTWFVCWVGPIINEHWRRWRTQYRPPAKTPELQR